MEKLERQTQKIFGGNAPADDLAALGSFKSGTPIYTDDIAMLQNEAYEQGYSAALVADEAPFLEEQNSVPYVLSKQLAYLFQTGIPEWDPNTTYYANTSFCQINGIIYQSLTDGNLGNNPATDSENWGKWGGSNEDLYSYITNAILSMPENAVSFAGLVATVKAGVRVLIPNGRNADGTLKNIDYTVTEDITHTESTGERYLFLSPTEGIFSVLKSQTFTGKDADKPLSVSANNNFLYYATDTNILYKTTGSTTANWTPFPCVAIAEFWGNTNSVSNLKIFRPIELVQKKDLEPLLNQTQITNCLLEVPQRIKYTLEDGTLTLKAGSVIIVPYGTEDLTETYPVGSTFILNTLKVVDTQFADGKFFVWAELQNDVASKTTGYTYSGFICMDIGNNNLHTDSATITSNYTGNAFYYNREINKLQWVGTEGDLTRLYSLPVGKATLNSTLGYVSVDQIFNGFGYIGSTIWVDKGVKGLIPNGRNTDGTLKNIEFTTSNFSANTYTSSGTGVNNLRLLINGTVALATYLGEFEKAPATSGYAGLYYNSTENRMYYNNAGDWERSSALVCTQSFSNEATGVVTSFVPKQAFHAADIRQVEMLISTYLKSFNTSLKAANGYIKLGDGVIIQWGIKTGQNSQAYTITLPTPFSSTNYAPIAIDTTTSNAQSHCSVTDLTTTTFSGKHSADGTTIRWIAIGY